MAIILASKSPRRRELISLLGIECEVDVAEVDENIDFTLSAEENVKRISADKAAAVAQKYSDEDIIISADTMVVCDGERLGKPKDDADAVKMLKSLSGKTHQVITAITVRQGDKKVTCAEITDITFRELFDEEIKAYVALGESSDKAGAYGIQGTASLFVSGINGDYFNVVGLPVCRLATVLRNFSVKILGK